MANLQPISRYPVPEPSEWPDDISARILEVQQKAGFVPNVFLTLAHRPDEFRAFFAYHDALMLKEGGLTKGEREMIVVATSAVNQCLYCVVAHGATAGQSVPLVTATEDGIRVTDVWQTRGEFEAFAAEQIGPLTAEVGVPAPPEITFHDVHNFDSADGPA